MDGTGDHRRACSVTHLLHLQKPIARSIAEDNCRCTFICTCRMNWYVALATCMQRCCPRWSGDAVRPGAAECRSLVASRVLCATVTELRRPRRSRPTAEITEIIGCGLTGRPERLCE